MDFQSSILQAAARCKHEKVATQQLLASENRSLWQRLRSQAGRAQSSLDEGVEKQRAEAAARVAAEKAELEAMLAAENAVLQRRLESVRAREKKALDESVERAREQAAERYVVERREAETLMLAVRALGHTTANTRARCVTCGVVGRTISSACGTGVSRR